MCRSIRLFLFLLVFLLLLPVFSWADIVLTDEEFKTLRTELTLARKELETVSNELTKSKEALKELQTQLNVQVSIWTTLSQSLTLQKREQLISDLKIFGLGFFAGNVTGGFAGFKLGTTIQF